MTFKVIGTGAIQYATGLLIILPQQFILHHFWDISYFLNFKRGHVVLTHPLPG